MTRREFLFAAMGVGACVAGWQLWPDEGWWNPCLTLPIAEHLANHELVKAAWEGLDPAKVWDVHVHLAGTGSAKTGIWVNPEMQTIAHPFNFIHNEFYLNAACINNKQGDGDQSYLERLLALQNGLARGSRLMLLALDYFHDETGTRIPSRTIFHIPNEYAQEVASQHPDRLEWIASIHPYRRDCVEALEWAVANGARAVKWIPNTMRIDPASPRCDRFYEALKRWDLPLLTHGGAEHPLGGSAPEAFNSPLALRRPLEHGVRVIVAHCASIGVSKDNDKGHTGPQVESFKLFTRLMDEPQNAGKVFGDISTLTQTSRTAPLLKYVLQRTDWHGRLLNGSDYPLPGFMPAFSMKYLVEAGFVTATEGKVLSEIRRYNPLLFDFVSRMRFGIVTCPLEVTVVVMG